jgi:beta-phosphoglucomutase-like phosphatase (HAD superfamily)
MTPTTRQVEAFIFDMDGTMIDSMPWHARSWVEFVRATASSST